jgi:hypothetical protein
VDVAVEIHAAAALMIVLHTVGEALATQTQRQTVEGNVDLGGNPLGPDAAWLYQRFSAFQAQHRRVLR